MFALRLLCLLGAVLLASGTPLPAQSAAGEEKVTLAPGDLLKVKIWREEDLSGEYLVNENGTVTLPLLGEQHVTGASLPEVRDLLLAQYRVHLRNPSISITPLRRINILGEVNKPGLYEVDPTVSLAGAVALAGGATPAGKLDNIRIIRNGDVVRASASAGTSLNAINIQSGDQIIVGQRSWLARNVGLVLSVPGAITGVVVLFNLLRN